ncbi:DUF397 domain-containing protein [Kitasatospora sp. NPDC006697]|uniref:DUF397 domain-containing protein n=1 Tax=Kitasatospora sp. NPDC006697 TaxID=3364020 RepID=UPI00369DA7ED
MNSSSHTHWRKSSYSQNGGNCIEVATPSPAATIPLRDSKDPTGPTLLLPASSFSTFIASLKTGHDLR